MQIIEIIFYIWTVLVIIGAVIPVFFTQVYWLRAWTYARLQMLALIGLTGLVLFFVFGINDFLGVAALIALGLCTIFCLYDVFPFTAMARKDVTSLETDQPHTLIRLLVANILMDNQNYAAMVDKVSEHDPDIVFLVETNQAWADGLSSLKKKYKYPYLLPLEQYNGMLFYSKFPILEVQERYLEQDHIPSLTIDLDVGRRDPLRVYAIHPRPPRPKDNTKHLDKELLFVANEAGNHLSPTIVTGDLNDVGWSSTTRRFLRTSGLRDPRRGRGLYNSYNAKNPLVRWPLDHVFLSKHFALKTLKRLEASGSDHFPMLIELGLLNEGHAET